jgi:2OG-Fe dioxygenase
VSSFVKSTIRCVLMTENPAAMGISFPALGFPVPAVTDWYLAGLPYAFASATVSDDAAQHVSDSLNDVWSELKRQGYAITNDQSIGLPEKFRPNFLGTYFNDWTLRHDEGDWPVDRQRARDVIRYQWYGGRLSLRQHDAITITDRADIPGQREHARVKLLDDPQTEGLIRAFLQLVPEDRREADGTFGVNLFRTFTNVVTKPHHDYEQFIITYVLDRIGDGAETYLYAPADVTDDGEIKALPILWQQLNPGDILIFEDKLFKHGATPLTNPPDGTARRDALICTVDDRGTYLEARS